MKIQESRRYYRVHVVPYYKYTRKLYQIYTLVLAKKQIDYIIIHFSKYI